ncbi:tyramine--L-glutamate ligase [Methanococcus aeolicus]|uniref:ATP-grasp domain-containing protein n=1 Tax=Methanococcus aeolicus (strain ATCC BAA-1280 / DSM 17508 / OCM 812 / Nankai-3) TaxID=419665 RepID=A6UU62_META3|nr:tyramine--L-glutamate ligase [Methanococcus aeolicus]ABR56034.1 protein of unknown function DUF201 [Methanococcus aeolicus Nankai-3]UXM85361.1 tyramine--L-glutamate ligase [Methanococcus aeolicus]
MDIYFFEYALGSGEIVDKNILEEGRLMFDRLLKDFLKQGYSVLSIVDIKYYDTIMENYKQEKNLNIIALEEGQNYKLKIKELLNSPTTNLKYGLIIAPECDNILYDLTKLLESSNTINLGAPSKAVEIAGDKYLTYLKIKDSVKTPKTLQPDKYIVKEIDGCGGERQVINNNSIIQEFIEGESYSVSFIVGEHSIYPLCLNKQYIKECYCGGETNIDHPLKEEIINQCKKAIQTIGGFNGYVGVDVIINNENIYILEINPRITTSIIGIDTNPSLSTLLVNNALKNRLKYTVKKGKKFIVNNEILNCGDTE